MGDKYDEDAKRLLGLMAGGIGCGCELPDRHRVAAALRQAAAEARAETWEEAAKSLENLEGIPPGYAVSGMFRDNAAKIRAKIRAGKAVGS